MVVVATSLVHLLHELLHHLRAQVAGTAYSCCDWDRLAMGLGRGQHRGELLLHEALLHTWPHALRYLLALPHHGCLCLHTHSDCWLTKDTTCSKKHMLHASFRAVFKLRFGWGGMALCFITTIGAPLHVQTMLGRMLLEEN